MLAWIIAVAAVALPVAGVVVLGMRTSASARSLDKLARERGWDVLRDGRGGKKRPGRAPAPLRGNGESVERGVVGTHRGRPFALYRYARSTGGFDADGTRRSGSHRTVIHVEVGTPLPTWVLTIGSTQVTCPDDRVTLRPEVEEWLTGGPHEQLYTAEHTLAVQVKGIPSGKRLLGTLDFLNGVADRLPLR